MSTFLNKYITVSKLAAPSWVIPGTIAENCSYLAGKVDEVALLFFETESCLAYTDKDLPCELLETGLSFHIHHPLDLPWHEGGVKVAEIVSALARKASHLRPEGHVVHPPECGPDAGDLIFEFADALNRGAIDPSDVLLENIKDNSLAGLSGVIRDCGFKICLDLGHILAYAQHSIFEHCEFEGLVSMLHLNAPGVGGRHESLDKLNTDGIMILDKMFALLSENGTVTVEVFDEKGFFNSLQFLEEYCMGKE